MDEEQLQEELTTHFPCSAVVLAIIDTTTHTLEETRDWIKKEISVPIYNLDDEYVVIVIEHPIDIITLLHLGMDMSFDENIWFCPRIDSIVTIN